MKIVVLLAMLLCFPSLSHAAKAVAVVTGAQSSSNSVQVQITITEDTGILFFQHRLPSTSQALQTKQTLTSRSRPVTFWRNMASS